MIRRTSHTAARQRRSAAGARCCPTSVARLRSAKDTRTESRLRGLADGRHDQRRGDGERGQRGKGFQHRMSPFLRRGAAGEVGEGDRPASQPPDAPRLMLSRCVLDSCAAICRRPDKGVRQCAQSTNGGQLAFSFRAMDAPAGRRSLASATSCVTLPTVRKMSGIISTATSSAKRRDRNAERQRDRRDRADVADFAGQADRAVAHHRADGRRGDHLARALDEARANERHRRRQRHSSPGRSRGTARPRSAA